MTDPIATFRQLHETGCFVMPNPWDAGTAHVLGLLGFHALASTSAGMAFSAGLPDQPPSPTADLSAARDRTLAHVAELVRATPLPVNADFQSGFGNDPDTLADSVRRCVATGVAGLSIEDATGDPARPLFDLGTAAQRIKIARKAIDESGSGVVLTARAECFLVGHDDPLREALNRLEAYADAGADVLFAPGLRSREQITTVVRALAPRPVNVLVSSPALGLSVAELADLGVRRISVGSALARTAWGAFTQAARELAEQGTFGGLAGALPFAELNAFFTR